MAVIVLFYQKKGLSLQLTITKSVKRVYGQCIRNSSASYTAMYTNDAKITVFSAEIIKFCGYLC
jgi:hypothetical protein